jgi:hypothetical protein
MTKPNDLTLQYSRIIAELRDEVKLLRERVECQDKLLWEFVELYAESMVERVNVDELDFEE